MREGLTRVLADTPVRGGFAELSAAWAPSLGLVGRAELGYRPLENLAAFAFGQVSTRAEPVLGAGVRVVW